LRILDDGKLFTGASRVRWGLVAQE
jgi:hypothetical protein